jgi:hypothetical protein
MRLSESEVKERIHRITEGPDRDAADAQTELDVLRTALVLRARARHGFDQEDPGGPDPPSVREPTRPTPSGSSGAIRIAEP